MISLVKKGLLIMLLLLSYIAMAQTREDAKKVYKKLPPVQKAITKEKNTRINDFSFRFCDTHNDLFETLDLTDLLSTVQAGVSADLTAVTPRIFIGTSAGNYLEIDDLVDNPTINLVCSIGSLSLDVAVDKNGALYTSDGVTIDRIDETGCTLNTVHNAGGNSLSFDTQNNLYFNDLNQIASAVYRLDAGLASPAYLWHDFQVGQPGGDFVILGNFMYIAWRYTGNVDVLYKVTIDSDFNYVSHEELGPLKQDTYGLASELGVLYGVTTSEVYKIDLETSTPSFETIITNDFTYGSWFGSAGFNEAVELVSTAHTSQSDADSNSNPLPNVWTNTVAGAQTIYIRTEDVANGNYVVSEVLITLDSIPEIVNTPPSINECDVDDNGSETFNFSGQTSLIMGSQDPAIFQVIYSIASDFSTTISDPNNFVSSQPSQTIYYRILNTNNTECYESGSFEAIVEEESVCNVNLPPEITVSGRLPYCPEDQILIAENFNITDPDDVSIESFTIQISSGYVNGSDLLLLTGNHPAINSSWNVSEGTLTLSPASTSEILYTDLIPAVREVAYQSLNPGVSGERFFSFNIGDANFLPSTGHFYEYVADNLIDWESARVAAQNRTYFGLQGYLATILTPDEAQLSGEQAAGTGWIGGSDAAEEGVWRWVTGPEAGTIFWNGGINGTTPNFAFWNTDEPNNQGNEDYAHVTDPNVGILGSWNDLPLTGGAGLFEPRGYIVEYGGMPGDPILNISGSTSIFIPQITSTTPAESCPDETLTLEAQVSEGEVYWYDAPTGGTLLSTGTSFTTPVLTSTTTYYAAAGPQDCNNTTRVAVIATINPYPVVNDPVSLQFCELDQDGVAIFDLTLANNTISSNFANESFQYYPSEADAQNDTNQIADPNNYQNVVDTNDSVWVRTISSSNCFVISRVDLQVSSTSIPSSFSRTYEECDDFVDVNNNDTDGITSFDFSDITADIIAFFPAAQTANISVAYYPSEVDANNQTNEITDISNYRNSIANTQQIYTRVSNSANNACVYIGTHITLNVIPVPVTIPLEDFNVCDDDSDGDDTNGFVQNIDLQSRTPLLLGTQDPALFTVTYHESAADATAGSNALTSPYTNTLVNGQTIYVRVVENSTGCFVNDESFQLNIRPLPVITNSVELKQCDTDTDGFSPFNLNEAGFDISTNYMNETFEFYETLADAQSGSNPIVNPTAYINQMPTSDMVWARAISEFGCYRIAEVTLTVSTTGIPATFQRAFSACDDLLDINGDNNANNNDRDGITSFDFSSVSAEVRALFPPTQQLTITYYRNIDDAFAEENPIADPSNYRNIGYPNTQDIYVRVDSDLDNDCLGLGHHITLTVDPVPSVNPVEDIVVCDDDADGDIQNGIIQSFNLTSQVPVMLGSLDPADFTITFHTSEADAISASNPISDVSSYENITAFQQTIYVRVEDNTTGCLTSELSFDLVVNAVPIVNPVSDLEICDDDSDGSARNGFSQSFDLESQSAAILGSQDPNQFQVTYHSTLANAQSGAFPLGSPFSNSEPFTQTIYVRVANGDTGCANGITTFDVIVNPEPITEDVSNLSYCDDDLDGDDTNGFVQNIDLDSQIPGILGATQDITDFTVTFHESQSDAQTGSNALTSPYSNTVADQQTIYVRIQNNITGCVNDDFTFDVIVNPLPVFSVTTPQIVCLNGPELNLFVENPSAVYDYVWTSPTGNNLMGPEITISSGGIYTVTATTTYGTGCSRSLQIEVNESIIATITEDDVTIVDDSDSNSITVDPTNLGIGDYEFALLHEDGVIIRTYQDSPVFDSLEGGIYTILVRDKNGCGVASLEVSVIQFPKFFTPNNDGTNDTWEIKGANSFYFPTSEINIFNRFGKIVAKIDIDGEGWDGTFNGRLLPSDDYWYSIKLIDRLGNPRNRQGNFSLLRK